MTRAIEVLFREKKRLESEKADVNQSIDSLEKSTEDARNQLVTVLGELREVEVALAKLER